MVALAVIGSVVGFSVSRENRSKITVQTGKAEKKDLVQVVTASGEVRPKRYVNVGANVSGRIIEIDVSEGERGQEGPDAGPHRVRALSRPGSGSPRPAVAGRERRPRSAREADLDGRRLAFERNKRMREREARLRPVYDQAEAEFKMKAAAVESARRRVAQLQAAARQHPRRPHKTTVISPMDGVVTNLPKEEGEVVIGAQSFSPTVIMTVADLSVMECEVMVDETDIRNLKLGQEAKVQGRRARGARDQGRGHRDRLLGDRARRGSQAAAQTSSSANTGNQAKDFKVTITLKDPPAEPAPGPERHRRHHDRDARRTCWPCPSRPWWCAR